MMSSPLDEVTALSLDDLFGQRPPFSPASMQSMISEFRRMRVKWQVEEREGKVKRNAKRVAQPAQQVGDDLWD